MKLSYFALFILINLFLNSTGQAAVPKSGRWAVLQGGGDTRITVQYTDRSDFTHPIETNTVYLSYSCYTTNGHFVPLTLKPIYYWTDGDHFLSQAKYDADTGSYRIEAGSFNHIQVSYAQYVYSSRVVCSILIQAEIEGFPAENAKWDFLTAVEPTGPLTLVGPFETKRELGAVRITFPVTPICANVNVNDVALLAANGAQVIHLAEKDLYFDKYPDRITYTTFLKSSTDIKSVSLDVSGRKGCKGKVELTGP